MSGSSILKSDVDRYLERIGYCGPKDASAAVLARLQECHLHAVPYENFDILKRKPLSLEIPDLFHKIVVRRRGGYCFELNGLFGWLLRELGYPVTDFFGRFWRDEPNLPPKRRHRVLKVETEGKVYLCDAGVGGIAPRRPIQMLENVVHEQGEEAYKLGRDSYYGWMLYERKQEQWSLVYSFTEEPQLPKDYVMSSFWCENSPDSVFLAGGKAHIRTTEGRNSIAGDEFRIYKADGVRVFTPQTHQEHLEAVHTYFGVVLE